MMLDLLDRQSAIDIWLKKPFDQIGGLCTKKTFVSQKIISLTLSLVLDGAKVDQPAERNGGIL